MTNPLAWSRPILGIVGRQGLGGLSLRNALVAPEMLYRRAGARTVEDVGLKPTRIRAAFGYDTDGALTSVEYFG